MQFKMVRALFTLGASATLLRAGASPRPARWPAVWRRRVQRRRKAAWRAWPGAPMELRLTCRSIVHWGAGRVTARRRGCGAGGAADARGGRGRAGALPGHARPAGRVCGRDAGLPRRGPRAHARAVRAHCGQSRLLCRLPWSSLLETAVLGAGVPCAHRTHHEAVWGRCRPCCSVHAASLRGARPGQLRAGRVT